jgi:hypothetical protein
MRYNMIEDSLKKIEAVLNAAKAYQKTSTKGDFEGRQLETNWPDIEGAFNAIAAIREELKNFQPIQKENP